jgi:phospholipid/cholesterol/gamma-HCH transport system ATP-binding protein
MPDVLSFRDVSYPGFFEGFSCEIPAGSTTLIVTARETECTLLTRLITGLSYPSQGSVLLNGQEVARLSKDQLGLLRQQIGVVPSNGGLVSNLKVWENITLPLLYHAGVVTPEDEQSASDHLQILGYTGDLMALPAHLSLPDKRLIALVRTILPRPRIIIYSSCFEGVPSSQLAQFSRLTTEFHADRTDRISLYLASSADVAADFKIDRIVYMHEPAETASRKA